MKFLGRVLSGVAFLAAASASFAFVFESKTWMYKGAKIHVAVGKREALAFGSYLVTVAASNGKRGTIRVDRDGTLVGAWAADVDGDGKFEVIVATQSVMGISDYGKVGIFTWTGTGLKTRAVPELNKTQLKGYMGHDQFSVNRNRLIRTYPIFRQKSNDPAVRTGMRTVRLNLPKFRWEAA